MIGSDSYGGFSFNAPIKIKARWQDMTVLFRAADGEEEVSKAVIYLGIATVVGDYVALGDFTATSDPKTLTNTFRIRQAGRSTDLRAAAELYKVFL